MKASLFPRNTHNKIIKKKYSKKDKKIKHLDDEKFQYKINK